MARIREVDITRVHPSQPQQPARRPLAVAHHGQLAGRGDQLAELAAPAQARSAHTPASRTATAAADAMSCTDAHSRTEWYSCPPVNRFGVGSPRALRIEPSVPPRIGTRRGSKPSRRSASSAAAETSGRASR